MVACMVLIGLMLLLGSGYPLMMSFWWLICLMRGQKEPYLEFMRSI